MSPVPMRNWARIGNLNEVLLADARRLVARQLAKAEVEHIAITPSPGSRNASIDWAFECLARAPLDEQVHATMEAIEDVSGRDHETPICQLHEGSGRLEFWLALLVRTEEGYDRVAHEQSCFLRLSVNEIIKSAGNLLH